MADKILKAVNIHKAYLMGHTPLRVLRGASLSIEPAEFVAIMGASGSGKSTLLHIAGALDLPDQGQVFFDGRDIFAGSRAERDRYRNRTFGFVFQFYHLLPELTVLENTLLPGMVSNSIFSWWGHRKEANRIARDLLEMLGLTDRIKHRPNELSGGERQRVALARALVNQPRVLLADEPTGNLDKPTGQEILSVLKELNRQGQTIIMVTHDPGVAAQADRVVRLVDGQIKTKAADPAPAEKTVAP